jgi:iron complex outermembrane receptor protein
MFAAPLTGTVAAYFTRCRIPIRISVLFCYLALPAYLSAQDAEVQASVSSGGQSASSKKSSQDAGAAAQQQKIKGRSETVVVHGKAELSYLPENFTLGTLGSEPLKDAPVSANVITRGVLNDQVARLLSDVVKNDASVQDDYVPVGYYGDYAIRGFPIDLATGIEINGMTVAGEQDVPLENKESVEILQGLAGVESGVASGGGVIDFVTRAPANVKAVDLATDQRGTTYGAAHLGRFFGARQQVGARLDLAGEKMMSYLNGADGWRGVGSGAADWKISPRAILKTSFEYQHRRERDGSGYQLLGGTAVPDIHRIYASTMLGLQPWVKPDIFDVYNTDARLDYTLPHNWLASIEGSLSHSLIDDNVIYAYGCIYESECAQSPAPGQSPNYFFAPDGTYDIYDYRNPGELRIDAIAEAILHGTVRTGIARHEISTGGELFVRTVHMPGFYTVANPYSADGLIQDGAVYSYVGSENIYLPLAPIAAPGTDDSLENPLQSAGPRRLWQDSRQSSGIVQDRMVLPGRVQVVVGGRADQLRDHNYSLYASCADFTQPNSCASVFTDKIVWLPQYAVTFSPERSITLYGNYGVMLSLGPQAPWWVDNGSQFLGPFNTRQVEAGAKFQPGQRVLISGDVFHMRAPFIYPKVIGAPDGFCSADEFSAPGDLCFESDGRETHNGLELSAQGNAMSWLRLTASAAATHAVSNDTGTPAFNGKQVIDVPRLRTTVFADVTVRGIPGLHVMPGWIYSGRNEATRDDTVSVSAWNVFNLGASYTPGGEHGRMIFHLYANNITDKRYWSDTGANYGDTFLWLGAPTTVRLETSYRF